MNGAFHAFLLDQGIYTTIDPTEANATGGPAGVLKINPAGVVVGSYTRPGDVPIPCGCTGHGFIYRNDTYSCIRGGSCDLYVTGLNGNGWESLSLDALAVGCGS